MQCFTKFVIVHQNQIFFALFEYQLNYEYIIWGQNIYSRNNVSTAKKKALRAIHFKERMTGAL